MGRLSHVVRRTLLSTCNRTLSASDQDKTSAQKVRHTWVLLLELSQVIDIFIDHNPEIIGLAMRRDVFLAKCLGHFVLIPVEAKKESGVWGKEEGENERRKQKNLKNPQKCPG